jgi:type VI secretion system protein ImpB
MGREASTAPKERINVTFKPATGNAQEEIELPMKVTVLGDFRQTHDDRLLLDRKPVGINRNNFADVMERQNLKADFAVPRRLLDGESEVDLQVKLSIGSMRDFEPESIINQVPELQQLNALRQALVSLKGPLGNLPAFRKTLEDILKDPKRRDAILREVAEEGVDIRALMTGVRPVAGVTTAPGSGDNGTKPADAEAPKPADPAGKGKN